MLAGWLALGPQFGLAADALQLSGSYQVVERQDIGPRIRLRLQIHLTNHGQRDLNVQRLALSDLSHPAREEMRACSFVVRAGASSETMQEFTLYRLDYESWRRANGPRLILEVQTPSGRKTAEVVRLHPTSGRKAD